MRKCAGGKHTKHISFCDQTHKLKTPSVYNGLSDIGILCNQTQGSSSVSLIGIVSPLQSWIATIYKTAERIKFRVGIYRNGACDHLRL